MGTVNIAFDVAGQLATKVWNVLFCTGPPCRL